MRPALREVFQADAIAWLKENQARSGTSVITSLPDLSEVPEMTVAEWRTWFIATARLIMEWLPHDGVAIFFQSDARAEGHWIDKAHLIHTASDEIGWHLGWHKIICRNPPGTVKIGRPSFSHMLAFKALKWGVIERPGPDVLADAGYCPWPRAMGEEAIKVACRFLTEETTTRIVVDPFCGHGSILSVANDFGFHAIGVERSGKRCRQAAKQTLIRR